MTTDNASVASPFSIHDEGNGTFRVYVYSVGLYPTGTREDAERLLRSLEHERATRNAAVNAELADLRALLARAVELFGAPEYELVQENEPNFAALGMAAPRPSQERPDLLTWLMQREPALRLRALADMREMFCFECGYQVCEHRGRPSADSSGSDTATNAKGKDQ